MVLASFVGGMRTGMTTSLDYHSTYNTTLKVMWVVAAYLQMVAFVGVIARKHKGICRIHSTVLHGQKKKNV